MRQNLFIVLTLAAICSLGSSCNRVGESVKSQPAPVEKDRVIVPSVPRPEYLKHFVDSMFGTTVTRVSDRVAFGSDLQVLRHSYSKNQPWNANESYLLLNYKYPAALLDARTYRFIRWVRQPSQSVWSNVNPSLMYGIVSNTNRFVRLNINQGKAYTVLHKFTEYDRISFGEWEGNLSNNDRYAALVGLKAGKLDFLIYDLLTDRVTSRKTQPEGTTIGSSDTATINNISMSQSGKYVVVQYNQQGQGLQRGIQLLDRSLNFVRQLSPKGGTHFDSCVDANGSEVIVVQDKTNIVSVRYSNGKKTTLLPASQVTFNIHISCRNLNRRGWAYISEFAGTPDPKKITPDRTFALKLDGSGTIEQFAPPHHSRNKAYERQPHSVPNRNGTKVLFASDWGNPAGPVDTYITEKQPSEALK